MNRAEKIHPPLIAQQIADYHRDGLVIVRGFFSAEELKPLRQACRDDPSINGQIYGMEDSQGRGHPFCTWTDFGDDIVGMIPRMARMVDATESLLGEPCYHWHSKFSIKTSTCKARIDWHQDYASWYDDGVVFPHMLTVGIAVEPVTRENGCVQFIPGSQAMGRVDHERVGPAHTGAFLARLEQARQRFGVVYGELDIGDAVFFHCNIFHGSDLNETDTQRVMIFCSYNAVSNAPVETARGSNLEGAFMGISAEERAYRPIVRIDDKALVNRAWRSAFSHTRFNQPDMQLGGNYGRAVKLEH